MSAEKVGSRSLPSTVVLAWILATGVILAALNLRTVVTSTSVILEEIRHGLNLNDAAAGLLTTLPVLAFAAFGALTPAMARLWGYRSVMAVSLMLMTAGLIFRAMTASPGFFLFFSFIALAAGAVGNVALPGIIKKFFPRRTGPITTAYSACLAIGGATAAFVTVPIEQFTGDWRPALALWALPSLIAIVPWLLWKPEKPNDLGRRQRDKSAATFTQLLRTPIGANLLVFCACQYGAAYILLGWLAQILRDSGFSAPAAGALFGFFVCTTIPVFLLVPALALRATVLKRLLYVMVACYPVGLIAIGVGLTGPEIWLWVALLGLGMGTFPLTLTYFNVRARTSEGTAALSGFAQPAGYLVAGAAPFAVGWTYGATGGWNLAFGIILALVAGQLWTGRYLARPHFIEDQLAPHSPVSSKASEPQRMLESVS